MLEFKIQPEDVYLYTLDVNESKYKSFSLPEIVGSPSPVYHVAPSSPLILPFLIQLNPSNWNTSPESTFRCISPSSPTCPINGSVVVTFQGFASLPFVTVNVLVVLSLNVIV